MTPIEIARVCHEANRALQIISGAPGVSPSWDDAPAWQRDSAIDGVRRAQQGVGPEVLHEAWCEFKFDSGWTYGPVKDEEAKTHPSLVDYSDLPLADRQKDDVFLAIVKALSTDD